jgi:hypothetical protein
MLLHLASALLLATVGSDTTRGPVLATIAAAAATARDSSRDSVVLARSVSASTRDIMASMADLPYETAPALEPLPLGFVADSIVVVKRSHTLTLFSRGFAARTYVIALGRSPVGDKERLGDNRTPEGLFHIDDRNAQSRYHLALHISYPDPVHLARARALGVPPGGDIMIHGLPKGLEFVGAAHRADDWTNGCIAVTNQEIDEIWRVVPTGTQIRILP